MVEENDLNDLNMILFVCGSLGFLVITLALNQTCYEMRTTGSLFRLLN